MDQEQPSLGMDAFARDLATIIENQLDTVTIGEMASVLFAAVRQFLPVILRGDPRNRKTLQHMLQMMMLECADSDSTQKN